MIWLLNQKNSYGEYVVNWRGGKEATAGYEATIDDAIDTGIASYVHSLKYVKSKRN